MTVEASKMAARKITAVRVRLAKPAAGGATQEIGEVEFHRIPVKSKDDYRCILQEVLDLEKAKALSEDVCVHQAECQGEVAGFIWRR
jgi:hypothetical protein